MGRIFFCFWSNTPHPPAKKDILNSFVFVHILNVGEYVRIEGLSAKSRNKDDGGSYPLSLHAATTLLVVKAKSFNCNLQFLPKHKICKLFDATIASIDNIAIAFIVVKKKNVKKVSGEVVAQLTIVDSLTPLERATMSAHLAHLSLPFCFRFLKFGLLLAFCFLAIICANKES